MDISRVRKLLRTHPTRVPVVCWRGSRRGGDDYKKLLMPKEYHIQEFVVKVKEHVPWAQDRSEVKCIPHDILLSGFNDTAHWTVKELYNTYALGDLCLHLEVSLGDVKEELSEQDEPISNFIPDPTLDPLLATFGEHAATNGMLTPPGDLAPIPAMPPYHLYGLGPAPATPPAPLTPPELGPVPLTPPDLAPCRSAPLTPVGIPVFTGLGPVPLTPPDLAPLEPVPTTPPDHDFPAPLSPGLVPVPTTPPDHDFPAPLSPGHRLGPVPSTPPAPFTPLPVPAGLPAPSTPTGFLTPFPVPAELPAPSTPTGLFTPFPVPAELPAPSTPTGIFTPFPVPAELPAPSTPTGLLIPFPVPAELPAPSTPTGIFAPFPVPAECGPAPSTPTARLTPLPAPTELAPAPTTPRDFVPVPAPSQDTFPAVSLDANVNLEVGELPMANPVRKKKRPAPEKDSDRAKRPRTERSGMKDLFVDISRMAAFSTTGYVLGGGHLGAMLGFATACVKAVQ